MNIPQLSSDQAACAIVEVVKALTEKKEGLIQILKQIMEMPPEQQAMQKMMMLIPAVTEAALPVLKKYGFEKQTAMMFMSVGVGAAGVPSASDVSTFPACTQDADPAIHGIEPHRSSRSGQADESVCGKL